MSKEIILTTNQMAFFIYNLFGHDITHDGHPSGLGEGRFSKSIASLKSDIAKGVMSSKHGGKNILTGGTLFTKHLEDEYFKGIGGMLSRNTLIQSIGVNLIDNKMLFVSNNIPREVSSISSENIWQNLSMIIIDVQTIIKNFNRGNPYEVDVTYPGYIYFDNDIISPYDTIISYQSNMAGLGPAFIVSLPTKNCNIIFSRDNIENIQIEIQLPDMTAPERLAYIQATKENLTSIVKHLGDEFLYTIFDDYMKNTALVDIEDIDIYFIEYILKKTGPTQIDFFTANYNFYISYEEYSKEKDRPDLQQKLIENFVVLLHNYDTFGSYYTTMFYHFIKKEIDPDLLTIATIFVEQIHQLDSPVVSEKIFANIHFLGSDESNEIIDIFKIHLAPQLPQIESLIQFYVISRMTKPTNVDSILVEDIVIQDGGKMTGGGPPLPYFPIVIPQDFIDSIVSKFSPEQIELILHPDNIDQIIQIINDTLVETHESITSILQNLLPRDSLQEQYAQQLYGSMSSPITRENNLLNFINSPIPSENDISDLSDTVKFKNNLYNDPTSSTVIGTFVADLLNLFEQASISDTLPNQDVILSLLIGFNMQDMQGKLIPLMIDNVQGSRQIADDKGLKILMKKMSIFEQYVIRQIRIVLIYLLIPKYFPVDEKNKKKFLKNFIESLNIYLKMIAKVTEMFESSPGLTTIQKINSAYMIATAVLSVSTSMQQIIQIRPGDKILDAQIKILSNIYLKKNVSSGKTGIGNIDDKLFSEFVTWLTTGSKGAGNFVGNSGFIYKDTKITNEEEFMATLQQNNVKIPRSESDIYYINNAVTAKVGLPPFFCPFSSIMDGQSTCNTFNSALKKDGIEMGTMDVIIRDGNIIGPGIPTTGESMRYHIRVQPVGGSNVSISAFLKIGDDVLINIGRLSSTPSSLQADPALIVDLNAKSSPLEASDCLREIINVNVSSMITPTKQIILWDDYLGKIQNDLALRRQIISASFRKSMGDYLQELNSITDNGGYIDIPTYHNAPGKNIVMPNMIRLGLSNDRPSGIRFILLVLFGQTGINPNCAAGFINPDGKYLIAIRDKKTRGGGLINKKTKRRKYKNKTKKYKNKIINKSKKNRYTLHKR